MATQPSTQEYLTDFLTGKPDNHNIWTAFATMVFGAFGGYMITGVPNKILLLWETWPFQFLTCLATFAIDAIGTQTPWWVIFADAALVALVIQLFVRISQKMEGTAFAKSDTFPLYDSLSTRDNNRPLYHVFAEENYTPEEYGFEDEDEDCDNC